MKIIANHFYETSEVFFVSSFICGSPKMASMTSKFDHLFPAQCMTPVRFQLGAKPMDMHMVTGDQIP